MKFEGGRELGERNVYSLEILGKKCEGNVKKLGKEKVGDKEIVKHMKRKRKSVKIRERRKC